MKLDYPPSRLDYPPSRWNSVWENTPWWLRWPLAAVAITVLILALVMPLFAYHSYSHSHKHDCRTQSNWCDQHGYGPGYGHSRR
jgi:hypothetical protein